MSATAYRICIIGLLGFSTLASAEEKVKYVDRNGLVFWLDGKAEVPPPVPIHHKYVDKNGLTHWVDSIDKIPEEYRNKVAAKDDGTAQPKPVLHQTPVEIIKYSTKITIVNNQIIVPVIFRNRGHTVKARMLLDTGASVTTIYADVASRLDLHKNKLSRVRSISANGAATDSLLTKIEYMELDEKILANPEVIVMPSQSNIGADGLLGNSFLRFFNFTIDYEKQLLIWNK